MLRLKGIRVTKKLPGEAEVVPLFYGPKGSYITRSDLREVAGTSGEAVKALFQARQINQDWGR